LGTANAVGSRARSRSTPITAGGRAINEISRRRLLQGTGALAAGLALGGCTDSPSPSPPPTGSTGPSTPLPHLRPNIVMIVADDIGYSDLGCFGGEIPTPNLDRLAQRGQRFPQLLTNPMCCPSRAALLTGLYPTQAGLGYYTHDYGSPGYVGHLTDNCVTLAQVLQSVGYRTAVSGKWHVSDWDTPSAEPPARGFDQSFCEVGGNGYFTTKRFLDGKQIGVSSDPNFYMTNAITGYARNRILEFSEGPDPFFLYVTYTAPHFPLQAPDADIEPFHGAYADGWDVMRANRYAEAKRLGIIDPRWSLPPRAEGVQSWEESVAKNWQSARMEVYAAQVHVMDRTIGVLLDTLEQQGILDDTLVLFMGDNGASAEEIHPHSRTEVPTRNGKPMRSGNTPEIFPGASDTFTSYGKPWGSACATPFRRYKLWVEEGGICTPFIASWPGRMQAGGIDHRPLHLMDFMPTLVQLTGATYPSTFQGNPITPMQGTSFASVLLGRETPEDQDRWLFWEFQGHRAARHGRWKIVNDHTSGPWRLYDMEADRTESTDLSAQNSDLVATMSSGWQSWKERVGVVTWDPVRGYQL
jgi:arylsulfatase A-like enzyme